MTALKKALEKFKEQKPKYGYYYNHQYDDPLRHMQNRGINCSMSVYEVAPLEHLLQFKLNFMFIKNHTGDSLRKRLLESELKQVDFELKQRQAEIELKNNTQFIESIDKMVNQAYAGLEKELEAIYENNFKESMTIEEYGEMMANNYTIRCELDKYQLNCYLDFKPPKEWLDG